MTAATWTLLPGSRGDNVKDLQRGLNAQGARLAVDGIYGNQTKAAVMDYQNRHGLKADGIAGPITLGKLYGEAQQGAEVDSGDAPIASGRAPSPPKLSPAAHKLIIDYEVGGGKEYYDRFLSRPSWPGSASGVTIGIGYDLGYEGSIKPWQGLVRSDWCARMEAVMGIKGARCKALIAGMSDIRIPWLAAVGVFDNYTLPNEIEKTRRAFPGADSLPPDVFGVLVSLVYNRGAGMSGDSRREMRLVRSCVASGDIAGIASAIESMKRLWPNVAGLRRRRDAEAALVRAVLP